MTPDGRLTCGRREEETQMTTEAIPAPKAWKKPDGTTVSCTEKVKVLEENWRDIREALQDALDDAILMGCTESQFKAEYKRLVESLTTDYREEKSKAPGFSVVKCDHWVLTVEDVEKSRAFYVGALGMTEETFGNGRTAFVYATGKVNLHVASAEAILPRAAAPTPGSADLCLIVSRPVAEVKDILAGKGIAVELGPVERTGAFHKLTSIYVRDPDGNLVELANEQFCE